MRPFVLTIDSVNSQNFNATGTQTEDTRKFADAAVQIEPYFPLGQPHQRTSTPKKHHPEISFMEDFQDLPDEAASEYQPTEESMLEANTSNERLCSIEHKNFH
jgi:hypothetical protein